MRMRMSSTKSSTNWIRSECQLTKDSRICRDDTGLQHGKCVISVDECISESINKASPDMDRVLETPATDHLFSINPKTERLPKSTADLFHSLTVHLLFVAKRARPDIQADIAFLCTRAKTPDVDD